MRMTKNTTAKILLCLLAFFSTFAYGAETAKKKQKIVLVADYWCPYNCEPNSNYEGVLVDIAREAFTTLDIEVEYKIKPWFECLIDFEKGDVDGIIGVSNNEVRNAIYPTLEQSQSKVAVFARNDVSWKYDGPSSLANRKIGLVDGYLYNNKIRNFIFANIITRPELFIYSTSENPVMENVEKLISNDIFVFLEDENVAKRYIDKTSLSKVKNAGYISDNPDEIFIVFQDSKPRSKEFANILSKTTFFMRQSGKMEELEKKYNIKTVYK
jgi:polar amino acid transport system substrate-binding protein